jgi:hypothetical protein
VNGLVEGLVNGFVGGLVAGLVCLCRHFGRFDLGLAGGDCSGSCRGGSRGLLRQSESLLIVGHSNPLFAILTGGMDLAGCGSPVL